MRRPQFTIKLLLWLTALVAAFLGGMQWQDRILGIRASEREQELERMNRGLANEIQSLVLHRGRMERKLQRMSKKLRDSGIAQTEIDTLEFRE